MLQGVISGGGAQGDDAEEEAEFDCRRQAEADQHAADNGDQAAADSRPHGDALGDADDEGHFPGEIVEGDAQNRFLVPIVARAVADGEDGQTADQPGCHHRPGPEEIFLDVLVEEQADDRRRQKACRYADKQAEPHRIAAEEAGDHLLHPAEIEAQHGNDGACLDADGIGIGGLLIPLPVTFGERCVIADAHDPLR
ncbi:MAG: hypothetical protein ACD_75C00591G0002 [uncultured bacterium]|nr:MAG: hypothetical protein ACD_75C00591G0002 [uncultured bacterium]